MLLGNTWQGPADDQRLLVALKDLLWAEVNRWRQTLGLPVAGSATNVDLQWLRAQDGEQHRVLVALILTWAYYIEQRKTAALARELNWSTRTVQLKIQAGRAELARVIAHRQIPPRSSHAHTTMSGAPSAPATAAPDTASRPPVKHHQPPGTSTVTYQPVDRSIRQQIQGQDVQAVIGPVYGSVQQQHTQHHHHYTDGRQQPSLRQGDSAPLGIGVVLVMAAGYWLIQTVPWVSIGLVGAITIWRSLRHLWRLQQLITWEASIEERIWHTAYGAAWIGAAVWSSVLALRVPAVFATPDFSFEQLLLVVAFVSVCGYVFWLSTVDLLLWINETDSDRVPWRWLRRHARWLWQQRWTTLGLSWLLLAVFSFSLAMSTFMSP